MTRDRTCSGWARPNRQRPHHRLNVWQSAKELVLDIYAVTRHLPDDERFGLVSQLRRGAVSVISNIAEGVARDTDSEFLRFLIMARGSLNEIDAQLEICEALSFLENVDCRQLRENFDDTSKQLQGLINRLRRDIAPHEP
jgi:four helix bundle protein